MRDRQVEAESGSYTMIFGKRAFFGYAIALVGEVKMAAGSMQMREVYAYHIDWDAPVTVSQRPTAAAAT